MDLNVGLFCLIKLELFLLIDFVGPSMYGVFPALVKLSVFTPHIIVQDRSLYITLEDLT